MAGPEIPQKQPYPLELAPGDYWWCACGRSATQPFCDGSHKGGEFQPMKFTIKPRSGKVWICGCKHTKHPPFCDGAHNRLEPQGWWGSRAR